MRNSDYAIVTSDNPRSEDPAAIIQEIEQGMSGRQYAAVVDRREAIRICAFTGKAGRHRSDRRKRT